MTATPGRDQLRPMRRIVRLMMILDNAGSVGATKERLIEAAEYGDADPGTQLGKDLKHLARQGWQIDNIAGPGESARYRMVTGDNRLRLALTPAQVAALQRAMILADREDLAARLGVGRESIPSGVGSAVVHQDASAELSLCLKALRVRARLRFGYKGSERLLHPAAVRFQDGLWYLSGVEDAALAAEVSEPVVKHFVVSRASDLRLDAPGSARPLEASATLPLDPLRWEVDPPVRVVLRVGADFVPDVVRLLGEPEARGPRDDGEVDLTFTVTHRTALRSRVYALGNRVRVVAPDDVRAELLDELRRLAG